MTDRANPILELTLSRLREFWRERGAVFWAFGFPVLLAFGLGIAFRNKPPTRPLVGVADGAPQWLADALTGVEAQEGGRGVDVERAPAELIARKLETGGVDLVVEAAGDGDGRALTYRYDPTRDGSRAARLALDDALQRALGRADVLAAVDETSIEAGDRYVDFLFPGILGMNLMGSSMWGLGYNIVLARKRKQLKRLAATPMSRSHFLVAMFLSRLVFLVGEIIAILAFGALVFDVTNHGSYGGVALVSLLGSAGFAAIALMIAARAESVEAAAGWLNFVMLPMWLLSGTFFSYERFPEAMHPFIRLLPLTALNDALRAVINDGEPFWSSAFEIGVLCVWAAIGFAVARRWFRWQ